MLPPSRPGGPQAGQCFRDRREGKRPPAGRCGAGLAPGSTDQDAKGERDAERGQKLQHESPILGADCLAKPLRLQDREVGLIHPLRRASVRVVFVRGVIHFKKRTQRNRRPAFARRVYGNDLKLFGARLPCRNHRRWFASRAGFSAKTNRPLRSGNAPWPDDPLLATRSDTSAFLDCFHFANFGSRLGESEPKLGEFIAVRGPKLGNFAGLLGELRFGPPTESLRQRGGGVQTEVDEPVFGRRVEKRLALRGDVDDRPAIEIGLAVGLRLVVIAFDRREAERLRFAGWSTTSAPAFLGVRETPDPRNHVSTRSRSAGSGL